MLKPNLDILIVASEATPFAKTGGLGDVIFHLAKSLRRLGHNPTIIIPRYRGIEKKFPCECIVSSIPIPISDRFEPAAVWRTVLETDIPVYLLDKPSYFDRADLYGSKDGDYRDNSERFIYFSRAIPELIRHLGLSPDIVHCHDWQTALVPLYLRINRDSVQAFNSIRTVFTFHDLSYQGIFWCYDMQFTGLSWEYYRPDCLEFFGDLNLLKSGIIYSDVLTTVSDSYCQAVQTRQSGQGLDGLLRSRSNRFFGICNGIDFDEWNPQTDPHLPSGFSHDDRSGKKDCKHSLVESCGFPSDLNVPLAGVIGRLNTQKGMDILVRAIPEILQRDINLCILGIGDSCIESALKELVDRFSNRIAFFNRIDDKLAHRIFGGSDFFLMPSRFEPGGISQLQAMRYGSVPIARSTFGLDETIEDYDERTHRGTGIKFSDATHGEFVQAIDRALRLYHDPSNWSHLVHQGMSRDVSAIHTAKRYGVIYSDLHAGIR